MTEFIVVSLAFFLGSFVQGLSGFGAALVAIPLLSLVIDIKIAVPLCMLTSVIMTTYMGVKLRRYFDRKKILPICLGSLPGIILGVIVLKRVPSDTIRFFLGLFLVLYSLYSLILSTKPRDLNPKWGYFAGFLSGVGSAALSTGGPPLIIYVTLNNWTNNQIKATITGAFIFTTYLGITVHAVSGMTTMIVLKYFLFAAPAVLLGTAVGSYCYGYLGKASYLKIIFAFLVVMGLMLMM